MEKVKKKEAFVVITQDAARSVQAENAGAGSLEEPLLLSQKINTHAHTLQFVEKRKVLSPRDISANGELSEWTPA